MMLQRVLNILFNTCPQFAGQANATIVEQPHQMDTKIHSQSL
jgi:hypothetical protein